METKELIKERRLELGLTLKELANRVGVSEATISRWESGEIKNMRMSALAALSRELRMTPNIIIGWDEDEQLRNSSGVRAELIQKLAVLTDSQVELLNQMADKMRR